MDFEKISKFTYGIIAIAFLVSGFFFIKNIEADLIKKENKGEEYEFTQH